MQGETPAWSWLAIALLVAPPTLAAADELDAAEAVLDASGPETSAPPAAKTPSGLFQIAWSSWVTASGGEPETNLELDASGWRVEELLRPRDHKLYPSTSVALYGELPVTDWLVFRGLIDTREIRDGGTLEPPLEGLTMGGNPAAAELRSGNLVRELSAVLGSGAITVEVGRFRADVADGLVYKDFGTGARMRVDFEALDLAPLQGEVLLSSVGQRLQDVDNNQLLSVRLDWMRSPFEYVGGFVALSKDENGEISETLRSAYGETLLSDQERLDALFLQESGSGGLAYFGGHTQLILASGLLLRARMALALGRLQLSIPLDEIERPEQILDGQQIEVDVSGLAADADIRYGLHSNFELRGFAFLLSGDVPPHQDPNGERYRYRSFIGLAPYWVWTGLFFSGGLTQGLYPNRATASGVNGRGVVGGGPAIEYDDAPWRAELRGALLASTVEPPPEPIGGHSRLYGVEFDLIAEVQALPVLRFACEIDLLLPGGFFPSQEPAYLALLMVTVTNAD